MSNVHTLACKYCDEPVTIRCKPEELRFYMKACRACIDDDRPGMARWERMVDVLGERHALMLAASSHQ